MKFFESRNLILHSWTQHGSIEICKRKETFKSKMSQEEERQEMKYTLAFHAEGKKPAYNCQYISETTKAQLEGQNVRNFSYPSRIHWSRPPNFTAFYLYIRIFRCPENI